MLALSTSLTDSTTGYIFRMFRDACKAMDAGDERTVLVTICRLYGLWQIEEQGAYFLKCES